MHALILAAGKGTRLRPLTNRVAKPAIPFLNIPLMGFPLYHLEASGLTHLVVNTHHCPESVEETLNKLTDETSYSVTLSHEAPDILGSGGAIVHARSHLLNDNSDGFFIYANGDEMMLFPHDQAFKHLIEAHKKSGGLATMMLCPHPEVGTRFNGVWIDDQSKLIGIGKESIGENTQGLHFTGVMVLSERIFDYLPETGECNILHDGLLPALAKGESVYGHIENDLTWHETGDPASFLSATTECIELLATSKKSSNNLQNIIQRYYPESQLKNGVLSGRASECRAPLNGSTLIMGDRVQISSDVVLKGFNVIGNDCHIGDGVSLENCILGHNLPPLIHCQLKESLQVGDDLISL